MSPPSNETEEQSRFLDSRPKPSEATSSSSSPPSSSPPPPIPSPDSIVISPAPLLSNGVDPSTLDASSSSSSRSCAVRFFGGYASLLIRFPHIVLGLVLFLSAALVVAALLAAPAPAFDDPSEGFEPRGSALSERLDAWNLMRENSGVESRLAYFPLARAVQSAGGYSGGPSRRPREIGNDASAENAAPAFPPSRDRLAQPRNRPSRRRKKQNYFCDVPRPNYAHLSLSVAADAAADADLFTLPSIKSSCDLESIVTSQQNYQEVCLMRRRRCCRSWSLGNYAARQAGRASCDELIEDDVAALRGLLRRCAPFFVDGSLTESCWEEEEDDRGRSAPWCRQLPKDCVRGNHVFYLFQFILESDFVSQLASSSSSSSPRLRHALTFFPIATGRSSESVYNNITSSSLRRDDVEISSFDFGLKFIVFDSLVKRDTAFLAAALIGVFGVTWFYTESIMITVFSLLQIVLSLGVSYFVYVVVCGVDIFPFMNLLAVVILIGVGTDDVFVFVSLWNKFQLDNQSRHVEEAPPTQLTSPLGDPRSSAVGNFGDSPLPSKLSVFASTDIPREWHHRLSLALRHSFLTMLSTSLTTSSAFLASFFVSSIVAVRTFSLFASVAVCANLFFTLTLMPSVALLHLRFFSTYSPCLYISARFPYVFACLLRLRAALVTSFVFLVTRAGVVSLAALTALVGAALFVLFGSPGLQLPSSTNFQVFPASNPMERYDLVFKQKFRFETDAAVDADFGRIPVVVVWGVKPINNARYFDPRGVGSLEFDSDFDISDPSCQTWMLRFCRELRRQPFYGDHTGLQLSNCFVETFVDWMKRPCEDLVTREDLRPCCNVTRFPFPAAVVSECMGRASHSLSLMRGVELYATMPGPRYDSVTGKILAFSVQFDSNRTFSHSYSEMNDFFSKVDEWTRAEISSAPSGLRGGWFVSYLDFFALQDSLVWGTRDAAAIAAAAAFLVMLTTTSSLRVAFFALLTIVSVVVVTAAALTLLGWELNVLESVTLSVGIGLAIDTTLHYAIAYRLQQRLAPCLDAERTRRETVAATLITMTPAVTLATLTTGLAGALMTPASVLAYVRLGIFLVIVMLASWTYGTFFFLSLLRYCGTVEAATKPWRSNFCLKF